VAVTEARSHRRLVQGGLVVATYAALTVVMTWPFVNYGHFADASYGGDARLIIWTLAWDNHAVLNGLPLFDSNVFFPAPDSLRYNEHLLGVSVATLPWAAAGASPVLAYNVTWWAAFLLNGLASFAWLRRFVSDAAAAFVGSLAFMCSFYVMLHAHGHLHLVWIWPLPLSALLLERWFVDPTPRRAVMWVAVVLMGVLTSWYMAVMVAMVNLAVGAGVLVWRHGDGREGAPTLWMRRVSHAACGALIVGACVYPLARHYVGITTAPGESALYAADVASYLMPPENTVVGRWWKANVDDRPRTIYGEQTLFAGWIAVALGLVGLGAIVRDRRVPRLAWVFVALAVLGFLLSLGPAPPLLGGPALAPFGWLATLPGFSGMRAPGRFALMCMLGWSGLTACGWAAATRRLGRGSTWATLVLVPLMLAEWFVVDFPAGKPEVHPIPPIYRTPEIRGATALVSLPEYRDQPDWFKGGDYLYYSTAHWRPIVNGFGRSEPPTQPEIIGTVRAFASNPAAVRAMGVQYVVVHGDRLAREDRGIIEAARTNPLCRLVAQVDSDYLFEVLTAPSP